MLASGLLASGLRAVVFSFLVSLASVRSSFHLRIYGGLWALAWLGWAYSLLACGLAYRPLVSSLLVTGCPSKLFFMRLASHVLSGAHPLPNAHQATVPQLAACCATVLALLWVLGAGWTGDLLVGCQLAACWGLVSGNKQRQARLKVVGCRL